MDIQRKCFEESNNVNPDWSFKFDEELQQYIALDSEMELQVDEFNEHWDTFRAGWQAAKAHEAKKLEGCVVVPKDQIEVWWQDSEEPENFATKEDDLSFIAQHIQDDEIMEINEHHTIHLPSITKFGAWVYQSGQRTFFVGNKDEVEAVRGGK